MCLSAGQWFGEEVVLAEMPVIYEIIAESDTVRVFRISCSDFMENLPSDELTKVEKLMWQKLKFIMDRVKQSNKTRNQILD
jgi:hypothetical protein